MTECNFDLCLQIAIEAHKGQKRKGSGMDYIIHPISVACKFDDEFYKCIAILHDVIEDSSETKTTLAMKGVNETVAEYVDLLSRRDEESYYDFIMRIKKSSVATQVKIQDIVHNMSDLKPGSLKDKYQLALHILEQEYD
jgi:(p)ppGpp synthase/HD superfamily hydrolase